MYTIKTLKLLNSRAFDHLLSNWFLLVSRNLWHVCHTSWPFRSKWFIWNEGSGMRFSKWIVKRSQWKMYSHKYLDIQFVVISIRHYRIWVHSSVEDHLEWISLNSWLRRSSNFWGSRSVQSVARIKWSRREIIRHTHTFRPAPWKLKARTLFDIRSCTITKANDLGGRVFSVVFSEHFWWNILQNFFVRAFNFLSFLH